MYSKAGATWHRVVLRRFTYTLVATLMVSLLPGAGGIASAAGPGPVFSSIRASNSSPQAGDTVFLTTRITATADILGSPTAMYLFPDGTPGPTAVFSRVGGSLRDGEWQEVIS